MSFLRSRGEAVACRLRLGVCLALVFGVGGGGAHAESIPSEDKRPLVILVEDEHADCLSPDNVREFVLTLKRQRDIDWVMAEGSTQIEEPALYEAAVLEYLSAALLRRKAMDLLRDARAVLGEVRSDSAFAAQGKRLGMIDSAIDAMEALLRDGFESGATQIDGVQIGDFFEKRIAGPLRDYAVRSRRVTRSLRQDTAVFDELVRGVVRYHRLARRREEVIASRTVDSMKTNGKSSAILIAGRAHAEGLERELRALGVRATRLKPEYSGEKDTWRYERRLFAGREKETALLFKSTRLSDPPMRPVFGDSLMVPGGERLWAGRSPSFVPSGRIGNIDRYQANRLYAHQIGTLDSKPGLPSGYVKTIIRNVNREYLEAVGPTAPLSATSARVIWPEARSEAVLRPKPVDPRVMRFLLANRTNSGLPLSYEVPEGFWGSVGEEGVDPVDAILERQVMEYSVNIYDAAVWQIALAVEGGISNLSAADAHTTRLLSGSSGMMRDIRAHDKRFLYGDKKLNLDRDHAYFYRIISDAWLQPDPKDGKTRYEGFPNQDTLHHEDWKPITGEQAWAGLIGPLQVARVKYGDRIPPKSKEMRLAMSLLPALEAMRSPAGAIYHAAAGTDGKHSKDISNENNLSVLAGLKMLRTILAEQKNHSDIERVGRLISGIEDYFSRYGFNREEAVFYQGGFWIEDEFLPSLVFAVDCQTWALAVLGPDWIDRHYGAGTALRMWQRTVARSGKVDDAGQLRGVGFTDDAGEGVVSVEWTAGAILGAKKLAEYYGPIDSGERIRLLSEAAQMRKAMEALKVQSIGESTAYVYASGRFFIPFGWWANSVPSLVSTAWMILLDRGFDPFALAPAI